MWTSSTETQSCLESTQRWGNLDKAATRRSGYEAATGLLFPGAEEEATDGKDSDRERCDFWMTRTFNGILYAPRMASPVSKPADPLAFMDDFKKANGIAAPFNAAADFTASDGDLSTSTTRASLRPPNSDAARPPMEARRCQARATGLRKPPAPPREDAPVAEHPGHQHHQQGLARASL